MMKKIIRALKFIFPKSFLKYILYNFPSIANIFTYFFWKSILSSGDVVIQGGADMGWKFKEFKALNALVMSKIVGKDGKVFVVEPGKNNFLALKKYLEKIDHSNIIPVNKALWSIETKLSFKVGERSNNSLLANHLNKLDIVNARTVDEYEVDTITIDQLKKEYELDYLDCICLTINGAEYEALQGAEETLNTLSPTLYIAASHPEVRPTIESVPYAEVIAQLLRTFNYKVKKDRKGWLYAEK